MKTNNSNNKEYAKPGVLYVDNDEFAINKFIKAFKSDYSLYIARSEEEARSILLSNEKAINVIIADTVTHDGTGIDLLSYVRLKYPNKRRILTSNYIEYDEFISVINEASINYYVSKPWDVSKFKKILEYQDRISVIEQFKEDTLQDTIVDNIREIMESMSDANCVQSVH